MPTGTQRTKLQELMRNMSRDMAKRDVESRPETKKGFIGPLSEEDTEAKMFYDKSPNDPPIESEEGPVSLLAGTVGGGLMAKELVNGLGGAASSVLGRMMARHAAERAAAGTVKSMAPVSGQRITSDIEGLVKTPEGDWWIPAKNLFQVPEHELSKLAPEVPLASRSAEMAPASFGQSIPAADLHKYSPEELKAMLATKTIPNQNLINTEILPPPESTKSLRVRKP